MIQEVWHGITAGFQALGVALHLVERPLTPLQQRVLVELTRTTNAVVKEVFTVLQASLRMTVSSFAEQHAWSKKKQFAELDTRTQELFHHVMRAVDEEIDNKPYLSEPLAIAQEVTARPTLREDFVGDVAIPHVKQLAETFDAIKPSIVDDINLT